jgi:hypothetical protein
LLIPSWDWDGKRWLDFSLIIKRLLRISSQGIRNLTQERILGSFFEIHWLWTVIFFLFAGLIILIHILVLVDTLIETLIQE